MTLSPPLAATLAMVAEAMAGARAPWWIIGSAAIAVHGGAPIDVADVDVLVDEADAPGLLGRIGVAALTGTATARFRSAVFARWQAPPLTVEIMAGFEVATRDGWHPIAPATRVGIAGVFVPSRAELHAMLILFDRPKDRARASLLAGAVESR